MNQATNNTQGPRNGVGCGEFVGGRRAQRRAESEERRKQYRLRWLDIMQTAVRNGKPGREAIMLTAEDAARLRAENPQRGSEIDQAFSELHHHVATALRRFAATTPNNQSSERA